MTKEQELSGGNASGHVVRIGGTVRKPWTAATPSVFAYMEALRLVGVELPAPMGRDEQGRQVTEFVEGELAMGGEPLTLVELAEVGALVRQIHDASAGFSPARDAVWETAIEAPGDELICHNDLAPWNLRRGERWVFIDWDAAAPSTRLWDLAYAVQAFTLTDPQQTPKVAAEALSSFVSGYCADAQLRVELPEALVDRAWAMFSMLERSYREGCEPWATMFVEGHGDHWQTVAQYVERNREVWRAALSGASSQTDNSDC
ncbi:MAG: phosphotransferase [Ancrocorticia sp.]